MGLKFSATVKLSLDPEAMSRVNDALFAATKDVFAKIEATAYANAPILDKATSEREPGELRDSIETKVTKVKAGVKARVFTAFFGAFEELGTAKERPRPFLWPALEEHILELPDALKAILSEE